MGGSAEAGSAFVAGPPRLDRRIACLALQQHRARERGKSRGRLGAEVLSLLVQ